MHLAPSVRPTLPPPPQHNSLPRSTSLSYYKVNENYPILKATIVDRTYETEVRRSMALTSDVRRALDATDRNKRLIKITHGLEISTMQKGGALHLNPIISS